MRDHSCSPQPFPTVPSRPQPSPAVHPPAVHPPALRQHVSPCRARRPALRAPRTDYGRTTASRPVPSGALGSPPTGPRRAPGRLGILCKDIGGIYYTYVYSNSRKGKKKLYSD